MSGDIKYETQTWGSNLSDGITVNETGLYYCKAHFGWDDYSSSQKIDDSDNAQFQLIAGNNLIAIQNAKALSSMFTLTLCGIAKLNAGEKVCAYVHTMVAGVKLSIQFETIKLRGDVQ